MFEDNSWSHEGDGWYIAVGGYCPVQGEGFVDGLPLYFRARGERWSFQISAKPDGDPVVVGWSPEYGDTSGYFLEREYGGAFAAGWMSQEHSRAIVFACIEAFRAHDHKSPSASVVELELLREVPDGTEKVEAHE